jgi:Na+/H+-dicarboxylate symporter
MIVVPLIVASMIVGVASLGDFRKLGRTAGKTITFYLTTTGFSVLVGIILVNIIRPGTGAPLVGASIPEFITAGEATLTDIIVGLIPDNIFAAAASGQILPLIVFSLVFGGVLTAVGSKGKPVITLFEGINAAIMKIVMLIIYFAPIGIFALIGGIVAQNQDSVGRIVSALGLYAVTVIIGLAIHASITLPLILKAFGRKKPLEYVANMGQALATAFTTASSAASLPVTMKCVEEKNKVDKKASSFVLPLGATINMDGTALYEAVAAIFIAQIYGIDLSVGAQVIIFFTAILASIGAAAIPEAGLVMMALVLKAVGLPLEGIGIILAIDWFLDRCRTTVNVWGDSVGAAVISETREIKQYLPPKARSKKVADKRKSVSRSRAKSDTTSPRSHTERTTRKPAKNGRHQNGRQKAKRQTAGKQQRQPGRKRDNGDRRQSREQRDRHDRKEKTSRPSAKVAKETIDRELDKVKQQLNEMSERTKATVKKMIPPEKEEKAKKTVKKEEDLFSGAEFSKMNLFGEESKSTSESIVADKKKPEIKSSALSITPPGQADMIEETPEIVKPPETEEEKTEPKTVKKKKVEEEAEEPETNGGDFWGRGKRKRPSK